MTHIHTHTHTYRYRYRYAHGTQTKQQAPDLLLPQRTPAADGHALITIHSSTSCPSPSSSHGQRNHPQQHIPQQASRTQEKAKSTRKDKKTKESSSHTDIVKHTKCSSCYHGQTVLLLIMQPKSIHLLVKTALFLVSASQAKSPSVQYVSIHPSIHQ